MTDPMGFFREAQKYQNEVRAAQAQKTRDEAYSPLKLWEIEHKKASVQNLQEQIAAREQAAKEKQAEKNIRAEKVISDLMRMRDKIEELEKDGKGTWQGVGTGSSVMSWPNGSPGATYRAKQANLKDQWSLQTLRELKALSPTGASGLGNPSNREFGTLSSTLGYVFDPTVSLEAHKVARTKAIELLNRHIQFMSKHYPQAQAAVAAKQQTLDTAQPTGGRRTVRRGIFEGHPVVQYSDGTVDYVEEAP